MLNKSFAFVSTMYGFPWGGSEELWARTARSLAAQGLTISASVTESSPVHQQIVDLASGGVEIWLRPARYSLLRKAWHRATSRTTSDMVGAVEKFLTGRRPDLVVLSDGGPFPPIELLELCIRKKLAFVTIGQANSHGFWMDDRTAERYQRALAAARRCYFVSNANLQLAERQLGCKLINAEVVRNPFNVDFNISLSWPPLNESDELRLASVARLHPPTKGQDILLEALATPPWRSRKWRLTLFGEGPMRGILQRLADQFGIADHVNFGGHIAVEDIWTSNHVLVMPSRYEGLPLAMVEAMLCGRPVLATDVGGHSEILQDGVTGFLSEAPTVPVLARSLERLWDNRASLDQMGRAGAERIRKLVPSDPVRVFEEKIKSLAHADLSIN
jgi:glycosyltransferase involved in cell wall biosynthesis